MMSALVCAPLHAACRAPARADRCAAVGAASSSATARSTQHKGQQPVQLLHAARLRRKPHGRTVSSLVVRASSERPGEQPGAPGGEERTRRLTPKQIVEDSLAILDRIIKEYSNEVFAEEGAAEATGESAVQDRQAVLRAAVRRHVGEVNEQFLGVLNQYISSAMEADQPQTVRILMGVREEVLAVVGDSLPAEVQVVDLLTTVPTVELMDKVLAIANGGGGTVSGSLRVPASSMEKVHGAASRIIEQMEDKDAELVNWRLLSLVCIARERARLLTRPEGKAPELHVYPSGSFPVGSLPVQEAALMKEMLRVGDPVLRRGLIGQALEEAREQPVNAVDPGSTGGGLTEDKKSPVISMAKPAPKGGNSNSSSRRPPVRPGRLLDCVWNARAEVARADGATDPAMMSKDPIYRRLTEIYETTVSVLQQMASA